MIFDIITDGENLISRSDEVLFDTDDLTDIIDSLKKEMDADTEINSLSAPQIGILKRVFCIRFDDGIKFFVNPLYRIPEGSKKEVSIETSATAKGMRFLEIRNSVVEAVFTDEGRKPLSATFNGAAGYIFQQMCDSLDGIPVNMLGLAIDDDWEEHDEDIRNEIIQMWFEELRNTEKALTEYTDKNPEFADELRKAKFWEGYGRGENSIEKDSPKLNRKQRRSLRRLLRKKGNA